jgi:hypothetical protein
MHLVKTSNRLIKDRELQQYRGDLCFICQGIAEQQQDGMAVALDNSK